MYLTNRVLETGLFFYGLNGKILWFKEDNIFLKINVKKFLKLTSTHLKEPTFNL